jgi:4-alpha-glucanotransferase
LFDLDDSGRAKRVAGVPPDYFSKRGQRWGNPVYRWDLLEKEGFRWWIQRLSHALSLFDMVRIDHFRGLVKFWSIPASERSAVKGKWVEASPDAFFLKVKEKFPSMPFIAEDLGYITPDVKEYIHQLDIPRTLVLQFAFGEGFEGNPYAPANHVENACVYTGTHDNNTSRGWFESEAGPEARKQLSSIAGRPVTSDNVSMEMIRVAMASRARFAVFPMQDVLGLGSEARLNTPGRRSGNWLWRVEEEQMSNASIGELAEMSVRYGRYSSFGQSRIT